MRGHESCGSLPEKMDQTLSSSLCRIPVRDLTRRIVIACSTHFTQPSLAAWAWDYRSAVRLLKLTEDGYGSLPLLARAPPFSSPCLSLRARNVKLLSPSTPRPAIPLG